MMYRIRQITILIGDLAALYLGLYFGIILRNFDLNVLQNLARLISPMTGLFALAVVIGYVVGLYDLGRINEYKRLVQRIVLTSLFWILGGITYFYVWPPANVAPKTILLLTAFFGFGLMALWRYAHNTYLSPVILKTTVVFVGLTPDAIELIRIINKEPERGYKVIGIVDFNPTNNTTLENIPLTNSLASLREKIFQPIHIIVIAPDLKKDNELLKELYKYLIKQTEMLDLAKFFEEITGRIPPFTFSEAWFLTNLREQQKKIYDRFRILMDYFFGIIIALFFGLTFPLIAAAIKYTSKGPLFFKQDRVGRNGAEFKIIKYRTMAALSQDGSAELDGPQFAEVHDGRVTKIGKFLRRSRLDELPQFINIFRNEMSLIGPRPERPEFVAQLTEKMPFYELRHLVKPGITGWAQLRASYYGTIDENLRKLEYDLYYIKNRNLFLDAVIILRTVNVLMRMIGR